MHPVHAPELTPGTMVRSHYRAKWYGLVLEVVAVRSDRDTKKNYVQGKNHIVACLITHDRWGRPLRKPRKSIHLSTAWLVALTKEQFPQGTYATN